MISASLKKRQEARYQRRKAARAEKKQKLHAKHDNIKNIVSLKSLYRANRNTRRGVRWKTSVQRYHVHLLLNLYRTQQQVLNHTYKSKGFVEFMLNERGKLRHIRSIHYSERVLQRSLSDNALVPMMQRSIMYDSWACLPRKGITHALNRVAVNLRRFYRKNGFSNRGVAGQYDFSGYFDSIPHKQCFREFNKCFSDPEILHLIHLFIEPFGYPNSGPFDRLHRCKPCQGKYTGSSLGLGSQVSQITAVAYPGHIDRFIKQKLHVSEYGRYMDDGELFFQCKSDAWFALNEIIKLSPVYGLHINRKKTRVTPLSKGFTFLKTQFRLTDTGKVIMKLSPDSITRQRRKMKKLAAKVAKGEIPVEYVAQSYSSWKGYALQRNARESVRNMDRLFIQLFNQPAPVCRLQ